MGKQWQTRNFRCVETATGGHEMKDICGGVCSHFFIYGSGRRGGLVLRNLLPCE